MKIIIFHLHENQMRLTRTSASNYQTGNYRW